LDRVELKSMKGLFVSDVPRPPVPDHTMGEQRRGFVQQNQIDPIRSESVHQLGRQGGGLSGIRSSPSQAGERLFGVWLRSAPLGLSGKLDLLIRTPEACYPVDFKDTEGRPS